MLRVASSLPLAVAGGVVFAADSCNSRHYGRIARHRAARIAIVCVATAALFLPAAARAQTTVSAEYRREANALSKLPNFVEWPAEAFATPQVPFVVCVYGNFSFGTVLSELTRAVAVNGRRAEVKWMRKDNELRGCQILFISRSEQSHYAKIFAAVRGAPVLTGIRKRSNSRGAPNSI